MTASTAAVPGSKTPARSAAPKITLPALLEALQQPTRPIRLPLLYRPAQLLVAMFMVVLPLVYVALIAGVVALTAWHATQDAWMLSPEATGVRNGRAWLATVILGYFGPIVIGSLAALFMIKPFFAPRPPIEVPFTLDEKDQEPLFRFVHTLCDALEAPRPVQIDVDTQVNAGARLHRGWKSLLRGDVSLTIGLPLAADLSLPQFAGVLAHEFGHFAQGGGMRMALIIRSINLWFARVVYERDAWDARLEELAASESHWTINLIAQLTRLMVWFSRRVLWVLMVVGHIVSCLLLRQMEHDADRFASRIAGGAAFVEMNRRIALLSVAGQFALQSTGGRFQQRRELPDDLPALVRATRKRMPDGLRDEIFAAQAKATTSLMDTHPCSTRRCEVVEAEEDAGVLPFDVPARVLFKDFDKLCRLATAAHFQRALGSGIYGITRLVASEQFVPEFRQPPAPAVR